MNLRTSFISLNYVLASLGISCLIMAEILSYFPGIALLGILAICCVLELLKKIPVNPPNGLTSWKLWLVILPLIYYLFQPPIIGFLIGISLFLLITRFIFKTEFNDYLYGYLVSVICLLVGAVFVQDIFFGALFLMFYFSLCWCFIFYNVLAERVGSTSPPKVFRTVGENETIGFSLIGISTGVVVLSLVLTGIIFTAFPRLGTGFINFSDSKGPLSGFSSNVQLGDVGRIKQNNEVVMRVMFKRKGKPYYPPFKVYWRGVALDHYDGKSWLSTVPAINPLINLNNKGIVLFKPQDPKTIVEQEVFIESLNAPIIFTLGIPSYINGPIRWLSRDQSYNLKIPEPIAGPQKWTLKSQLNSTNQSFIRTTPKPSAHLFPNRYLQLPNLSPQIKTLAKDLVKLQDSEYTKGEKILKFFKSQFGYTLNMERHTKLSPLDEFLFVNKEGHCEYFASAMVILLRLNGIPARIVNGFLGVERNELGNYMVVRQAHAHSWVEAYISGKGWTVFDPTPSAGSTFDEEISSFEHNFDRIKFFWQKYVLKYSFNDQLKIVEFFDEKTNQIMKDFQSFDQFKKDGIQKILSNNSFLIIIFIISVVLLWILSKSSFWKFYGVNSSTPFSVRAYKKMLHKLDKQGFPKKQNWTHHEYLFHLNQLPLEKLQIVKEIGQIYEKSRFGTYSISSSEKQYILKLVEQI